MDGIPMTKTEYKGLLDSATRQYAQNKKTQSSVKVIPVRETTPVERSENLDKQVDEWVETRLPLSTVDFRIKPPVLPSIIEKGCEICQSYDGPEIEFSGGSIGPNSLQTLRKSQWLDDEIINSYMELLTKRSIEQRELIFSNHENLNTEVLTGIKVYQDLGKRIDPSILKMIQGPPVLPPKVSIFTSFFYNKLTTGGNYNYEGVRRWTARKKIDVFEFDYLLFPVNVAGVHWVLAVVDFSRKRTCFLDSMGSVAQGLQFHSNIIRYLQDEHLNKKKSEFDVSEWVHAPLEMAGAADQHPFYRDPSTGYPAVPQQDNSSDCGVFTCALAECISDGRWPDVIDFSCSVMENIRYEIAYNLVNERIPSIRWEWGMQ